MVPRPMFLYMGKKVLMVEIPPRLSQTPRLIRISFNRLIGCSEVQPNNPNRFDRFLMKVSGVRDE